MNQKNEEELNLALNLSDEERAKTYDLNTGYDMITEEWELIVRYSGDIEKALEPLNASVQILSGGYAIVKIGKLLVDALASLPEIIYVEKPKKLVYELDYSVYASCVTQVWSEPYNLSGNGCIIAIIDSGMDYFHPDFQNDDGTTRILAIYDEESGVVYEREDINEAIRLGDSSIVPVVDRSGHGTHVAGIAAGNGRALGGKYKGVAYNAELLAVRLGRNRYFNTASLMKALDFCINRAVSYQKPIAINISLGNNYGAHDGASLLETYLNYISSVWKTVIVAGTGNEASKRVHIEGYVKDNAVKENIVIGEREPSLDMQLWKNYGDDFLIYITGPDGQMYGPVRKEGVTVFFIGNGSRLYVYYGEPAPYSTSQEILFQWIGGEKGLPAGIWTLNLEPVAVKNGRYDGWLSSGAFVSRDTGFENAVPETTLTIPSTAYRIISVGAYDAATGKYADFSGRGYTRVITTVKPDLVAPGVNIMAASPGGGYTARTGTSMAAPFVTGAAALLMEWGIIKGNDLYLYGEKVKAYLIRGAKSLPGFPGTPNMQTGDNDIIMSLRML